MKFITLMTLLTGLLLCACGSDNECQEPTIPTLAEYGTYNDNISQINAYLQDNSLVADTLLSGLRYIIDSTGNTMRMPVVCDEVNVTYKGYFLDGTEFDSGTLTFGLRNVIKGWQLGIPLFGEGGGGKLFIPSYLAYGVNGNGSIGANTPLIFDVTLHSF